MTGPSRATPEWRWLGRQPILRKIIRGLKRIPKPERWNGLVRVQIPVPRSLYPPGPSIAFSYPTSWHVTLHRLDNIGDPKTVFAVSSYPIPAGPV